MKPWEIYRAALVAAGFTVTTSRHTEPSRAKATAGQRVASYTVRLVWPDGRRTNHNAPDSLTAAYRQACAATVGVPDLPAPLLLPGPAGEAPLRTKARRGTEPA